MTFNSCCSFLKKYGFIYILMDFFYFVNFLFLYAFCRFVLILITFTSFLKIVSLLNQTTVFTRIEHAHYFFKPSFSQIYNCNTKSSTIIKRISSMRILHEWRLYFFLENIFFHCWTFFKISLYFDFFNDKLVFAQNFLKSLNGFRPLKPHYILSSFHFCSRLLNSFLTLNLLQPDTFTNFQPFSRWSSLSQVVSKSE